MCGGKLDNTAVGSGENEIVENKRFGTGRRLTPGNDAAGGAGNDVQPAMIGIR
jgi:hypothetical protein